MRNTRNTRDNFSFFVTGLGLLLVGGGTSPTSAAVTAEEPFAYSTGALAGNNGGTGFTAGWTGAGTVVTGSLDSPVATGETGNKATITGGGSSATAFRQLNADVKTGTVYVGFIFARNTTGTRTTGLSLFGGTSNERLFIGVSSVEGNGDLFISGGTGSSGDTNMNATVNTAFQLVAKVTFFSSGNEVISLFVNQATEGTANATASTDFGPNGFNFIRLFGGNTRSGEGTGSANFDEIRITDNYADALAQVPEPTSLAFIGLCSVVLLRRRRR